MGRSFLTPFLGGRDHSEWVGVVGSRGMRSQKGVNGG